MINQIKIKNNFLYFVGGFIFLTTTIQMVIKLTSNQITIQEALSNDGLIILLGIFLIVNNYVFKADQPNDERAKEIRMKSGYYSYLATLVVLLIFLLLANYNLMSFHTAMISTLFSAMVILPVCLVITNKTM